MRKAVRFLLVLAFAVSHVIAGGLHVYLIPALSSPQPVGTPTGLTTQVTDAPPGYDAGFEPAGSNILTLLDNGHARHNKDSKANTRGQAWQIDKEAPTATLVRNVNFQVYSPAVGSPQTLKNGGYSFEAGYNDAPVSPFGRRVETDHDGRIVFAIDVHGILVYRSYRVEDMYSAPTKSPTK